MISGRDIAIFSARMALEKKATDVVIYDVRGVSDVSDYLVIATAFSRSQVRAVIESIKKELKVFNVRKFGQEGNEGGSWVLLDFSDCVIHVFSPELREYYSLESLWGDAPKVDWKKEKFKFKKLGKVLAAARLITNYELRMTFLGACTRPKSPHARTIECLRDPD